MMQIEPTVIAMFCLCRALFGNKTVLMNWFSWYSSSIAEKCTISSIGS